MEFHGVEVDHCIYYFVMGGKMHVIAIYVNEGLMFVNQINFVKSHEESELKKIQIEKWERY